MTDAKACLGEPEICNSNVNVISSLDCLLSIGNINVPCLLFKLGALVESNQAAHQSIFSSFSASNQFICICASQSELSLHLTHLEFLSLLVSLSLLSLSHSLLLISPFLLASSPSTLSARVSIGNKRLRAIYIQMCYLHELPHFNSTIL